MRLENIETKFLEVTGLSQDLSQFPITELVQFPIRKELSKSHGEVFTPLSLVDKMLLTSNPQPDKFNLDLCTGRGQFTIRMLRKFTQENPDFDINNYLTQYHWFNEINEDSCGELIHIFGKDINLAIGPAQELSSYPEDSSGVWLRGIFKFHKGHWREVDHDLNFKSYREMKPTQLF